MSETTGWVGLTEIYEKTQEHSIVHLAGRLIPIGSLLLLAIHNCSAITSVPSDRLEPLLGTAGEAPRNGGYFQLDTCELKATENPTEL